ncbi:MAG: hypothetical protein ACM3ML_10140 [Micromonosporaceae bacterium]
MDYNKVAADEARRAALHGSMKSQVEREVNEEIAERAERATTTELQRMEQVAGRLRGKAIEQVVRTDRTVIRERGLARLSQYIDYLFYVLYGLLVIRLSLGVIGANSHTGFVQLIRNVTEPFYGMFRGIVSSPVAEDGSTFALPVVIALISYMILHLAVKSFLRLVVHRRTEI